MNVQFKDVIGQKHLKANLIREAQSMKISHAQLFSGKSGFGSLPLALAFAQYLYCENKNNNDSCGQCAGCKKVEDLQHPDLHFVFPSVQAISKVSDFFIKNWRTQIKEQPYFNLHDWTLRMDDKERKPIIGTEESKEIVRKLSLKSYEGGLKIMVIWMAEEMNAECANKLLKILEEPPPSTLFFLISENPEKLLITIQSRTQLLRIPKIDTQDLTQYLNQNMQLDKMQAESIAAFAEGDFLKALELINADERKELYREQFIKMMRASYKKDVLAMMDWADEMGTLGKESQKLFMVYALHMFRQSLIGNYLGQEMMRVSKEEEAFLKNFAPFITGNNIREFMQTFDEGFYHIDRNANARVLFTQICFQAMRYIHVA